MAYEATKILGIPLDEGTNTSVTGYRANRLVVVSLVTEEGRHILGIPLDE
jgi:hypothetical protein